MNVKGQLRSNYAKTLKFPSRLFGLGAGCGQLKQDYSSLLQFVFGRAQFLQDNLYENNETTFSMNVFICEKMKIQLWNSEVYCGAMSFRTLVNSI